jgi:hypothetical protein
MRLSVQVSTGDDSRVPTIETVDLDAFEHWTTRLLAALNRRMPQIRPTFCPTARQSPRPSCVGRSSRRSDGRPRYSYFLFPVSSSRRHCASQRVPSNWTIRPSDARSLGLLLQL